MFLALCSRDGEAVGYFCVKTDGQVSLRDVLFLTHPGPQNDEQRALWADLANKRLKAPDTWESNLSAGADPCDTFVRLLREKKLGALALLRNLRHLLEVKVPIAEIREGLKTMATERVLPFRFITAAKYAPSLEPELESAMFKALDGISKLPGKTLLLVDNSGSMESKVSGKSELTRSDAACALAMLVREVCEDCRVLVFSDRATIIPARRGFALRDLIRQQYSGGTDTGRAVRLANVEGYDRIIVVTDEQSHTNVPPPLPNTHAYFINVSVERNGVGYGAWTHIDGWSEQVIEYITQFEAQASTI